LDSAAVIALGWTLIHFLWQGAIIAVAGGAAMNLLRRNAQARYVVGVLSLSLMLIAPVATFSLLSRSRPTSQSQRVGVQESERGIANPVPAPLNLDQPSPKTSLRAQLEPALPWILPLWAFGVLLLSIRLLGGWFWLRRLRHQGIKAAPAELHLTLSKLCRELKISRTVRLLKSAAVEVPMVIGWLRPIILLPVSALTALTPQQIEAVLAHELAHIRRHDFAVNLIQSLIEVLLFYHPAVWWMSNRVRQERELCCDDVAIQLCGDALSYAQALASLENLRVESSLLKLALAANGGPLMNRIRRLIQPNFSPVTRLSPLAIAFIAITALGASGVAIHEQKTTKVVVKSNGDHRLKVEREGNAVLKPATSGEKEPRLEGEGSFRIEEKKKGVTRRYEASPKKRSYSVNGQEKPLDAEGEAWLKDVLKESDGSESLGSPETPHKFTDDDDVIIGQVDGGNRTRIKTYRFHSRIDDDEIRKMTKDALKHSEVWRKQALEAQKEARRFQYEFKDEGLGKHRIIIKKDGKVESDQLVEIPEMSEMEFPKLELFNGKGEGDFSGSPKIFLRSSTRSRLSRESEIKMLQAQIERMNKRLEKLQKESEAAPKTPEAPKKEN
jgi:beta-lactamase regulating signal transducer with metallopeptidase domain